MGFTEPVVSTLERLSRRGQQHLLFRKGTVDNSLVFQPAHLLDDGERVFLPGEVDPVGVACMSRRLALCAGFGRGVVEVAGRVSDCGVIRVLEIDAGRGVASSVWSPDLEVLDHEVRGVFAETAPEDWLDARWDLEGREGHGEIGPGCEGEGKEEGWHHGG